MFILPARQKSFPDRLCMKSPAWIVRQMFADVTLRVNVYDLHFITKQAHQRRHGGPRVALYRESVG